MLSIPHLIIIFVVALVVFGPEKLPELARNLGKVLGEFRRATGDLRSTFEDHLRDLERETEQRRIGGTGATATAASTSETPAAPVVTPAEGIVPTMPPHSAVGTPPLDEPDASVAAPLRAPAVPDVAESAASEPAADPEHSGVQPNTEKER
jgi:TatA/E family protein of Tat protein translocase